LQRVGVGGGSFKKEGCIREGWPGSGVAG
jgi:hypothetical protein